MSDSIPLSKEHGIRPVLMYCPGCGKESGEIALVGDGRVYTCRACRRKVATYTRPDKCPACRDGGPFDVSEYDESVKLYGGLCDECQKREDELNEIVKSGGVSWRCSDCGSCGVVKPGEFASEVRKHLGVEPPEKCGVEFTRTGTPPCPVCSSVDA